MKDYIYTRDMSDCIEEAKKTLNKRYQTAEVAMLALQLWRKSRVEKER